MPVPVETTCKPGSHRWLIPAALTLGLAVALVRHLTLAFTVIDAEWYLRLARADQAGVMQPFASRQLGPLVVHALAILLHWPVERAFLLQGLVCFTLVLAFVFSRAERARAPLALLAGLVLLPFWPQLLIGLALPDLWYAALLCLFLLLLERDLPLYAAAMMFPLMLSRESTSLVLLCFLLCLRSVRRARALPAAALALAGSLAGMAAVHRLALHSAPNGEHLPQALYLLAKIPWNLSRNVLGVLPWSNVYPWLCHDTGPIWQMAFPLGPVRAVGLCAFSPVPPRNVVVALSTTFGLLPLLTASLLWRTRREPDRANLLLRFTLLYGGLCFLLAPVLGVAFNRLTGYAWPVFLVALPLLAQRLPSGWLTFRSAMPLLALHVVLGFCGLTPPSFLTAALGLLLNAAALFYLRSTRFALLASTP